MVARVQVTVEAKYMDYQFCCAHLGKPTSCRIHVGGDGTTRLHASFRKVRSLPALVYALV